MRMAKGTSNKPKTGESDAADPVMERMNEALKKMMDTPHETQKEMIARRRKGETGSPNTKKRGTRGATKGRS